MGKYEYEVIMNNAPTRKTKPIITSFGGTKDIQIFLEKQKVRICFNMTVLKTSDELINFKLNLFRDVYRKAHLLHVIILHEGLDVKEIKIKIEGEEYCYNAQSPNFPFLFSMIDTNCFSLPDSWNETMALAVARATKTTADENPAYAALFAFLAGKGRVYEIDRFINLWTAINGLSNCYGEAFYQFFAEKYPDLLEDAKIKKHLRLVGKDYYVLSLVVCTLDLAEGLLDNNIPLTTKRDLEKVSAALSMIPESSYGEILAAIKCGGNGIPFCQELVDKLSVANVKMELYGYMLFQYPYLLRCNYIHGGKTTLLLSAYNDYEIGALRFVNYMLYDFLAENIPKLFIGRCLLEHNDISRFMSTLGKRNNAVYRKIIDRLDLVKKAEE